MEDKTYAYHISLLRDANDDPIIASFFEGPQRFWTWHTIQQAEKIIEMLKWAIDLAKAQLAKGNKPPKRARKAKG